MNEYESISSAIRRVRIAAGATIHDAARSIGIDVVDYGEIERGRRLPTPLELELFVERFGPVVPTTRHERAETALRTVLEISRTCDPEVGDQLRRACASAGIYATINITERRVPVQGHGARPSDPRFIPSGTIVWDEHVEVWGRYASIYGTSQSAERIAERGGFGYHEIVKLLGHKPKTWRAR